MGLPGYYLIELDAEGEPDYDVDGQPVISGSLVTLPVQERIEGEYGQRTYKNRARTERGRRYGYRQWEAEFQVMTFRLDKDTELPAFRALHDAVGGDGDPFIYVFDVDESPMRTLFCKKEPDFKVKRVSNVAHGQLVDYVMEIEEEPTGPLITD